MQITVSEVENTSRSLSESPQAEPPQAESSKAESIETAKFCTLPYQANHQVELLHLHAEIESLLQQVRTLKQQRLIAPESSDSVEAMFAAASEASALSLR
jgi:vacuolar-type H+-ATPase subunit I/STV1